MAEPREEYRVEEAAVPVARFGLAGDALVLTTDPEADVRRIAGALPSSAGEPRGALSGGLRKRALRDYVARRLDLPAPTAAALAPLGDLAFSLRAELDRLEGRAELPFGGVESGYGRTVLTDPHAWRLLSTAFLLAFFVGLIIGGPPGWAWIALILSGVTFAVELLLIRRRDRDPGPTGPA